MDTIYNTGYPYTYPYAAYEPGFAYQPQVAQNIQMPSQQSSLTGEEAQELRNSTPHQRALDLSIENIDNTRAICNHKDGNHSLVQLIGDGSDDVYCPLCGARWDPTPATKEEVAADVRKVVSHMQNAKWTGELPVNVIRQYFPMIPLLEKLADIYEYGAKTFQKMYNQRGYMSANDANLYAQFNSLYGPGAVYGAYPSYPQPQPNGYYQPPVAGQPATTVNPMEAPVYGAPGYNPQFGNQANMMMGGSYYAQPNNPYGQPAPAAAPTQAPYSPVYGNAVTAQPQVQQPVQQPQQQAQQPATATTTTKVDL